MAQHRLTRDAEPETNGPNVIEVDVGKQKNTERGVDQSGRLAPCMLFHTPPPPPSTPLAWPRRRGLARAC